TNAGRAAAGASVRSPTRSGSAARLSARQGGGRMSRRKSLTTGCSEDARLEDRLERFSMGFATDDVSRAQQPLPAIQQASQAAVAVGEGGEAVVPGRGAQGRVRLLPAEAPPFVADVLRFPDRARLSPPSPRDA